MTNRMRMALTIYYTAFHPAYFTRSCEKLKGLETEGFSQMARAFREFRSERKKRTTSGGCPQTHLTTVASRQRYCYSYYLKENVLTLLFKCDKIPLLGYGHRWSHYFWAQMVPGKINSVSEVKNKAYLLNLKTKVKSISE